MFFQAFGLLGPPLLFVVTLSAAWTVWLMALNFDPNATANFLMGTEDFDNGSFWLLLDTDPALLAFILIGLGSVLLGFVFAILKMTLWRNKVVRSRGPSITKAISQRGGSTTQSALQIWNNLTGFQGKHRKLWVRSQLNRGR